MKNSWHNFKGTHLNKSQSRKRELKQSGKKNITLNWFKQKEKKKYIEKVEQIAKRCQKQVWIF